MSVLDALAPDADENQQLRVTNVTRGTNKYGDYIRIDGDLNDGINTCVFVDSKDFGLAEPYVQRWMDDTHPFVTVPIFLGRDERWKFSPNGARRELGREAPLDFASGTSSASYERERPTIKGEIAERLRREAGRRHLTVSELAMLLLDHSLPAL